MSEFFDWCIKAGLFFVGFSVVWYLFSLALSLFVGIIYFIGSLFQGDSK